MSKSKILSELTLPWPRWVLGWIPFWLATAVVIKGAVLRPEEIPVVLAQINDKLLHFLEYFFLFFFAANAFRRARTVLLQNHPELLAWIYCLLTGVLTEWLQRNVPGRSSDAQDWIADAAGSSAGLVLAALMMRLFSLRKQKL